MNSYERVLAMLEGRPVDHLPNMPVTMKSRPESLAIAVKKSASVR